MQKSLSLFILGAMAIAVPASVYAQQGDAAKGKEVFDQNCAVCHNADSTERKMGPGLKGLFKKDKMTNGKPVNDASVLEQINTGGNGMPGYKDTLSADEKTNLIAYLKTL